MQLKYEQSNLRTNMRGAFSAADEWTSGRDNVTSTFSTDNVYGRQHQR